MANKALGRDLGDLLTRARPARLVERAGEAGPRFGHGARPESEAPESLPLAPAPAPSAVAPSAVAPPASASASAPVALTPASETLPLPLEGATRGSTEPPPPSSAPATPYVHKPSRSPYVTYPAPSTWRAAERSRALNWPLRRVVLWGVDAGLVVVAMVCAFGGFLGDGLGKGLAIVALLAGAILFWLGSRSAEPAAAATEPNPHPNASASATTSLSANPELALGDAASGAPSLLVDPPSPPASKIRVHLTRV